MTPDQTSVLWHTWRRTCSQAVGKVAVVKEQLEREEVVGRLRGASRNSSAAGGRRGQVMSLWLVMLGEKMEEVPCDRF